MLVEITIQFTGQTITQRMEVEPTERRTAMSLVESHVRRLSKEYAAFKPQVSWREVK